MAKQSITEAYFVLSRASSYLCENGGWGGWQDRLRRFETEEDALAHALPMKSADPFIGAEDYRIIKIQVRAKIVRRLGQ